MADHRMPEKQSVTSITAGDENSNSDNNENVPESTSTSKGWRFWLIFLAVCVATLVIAVDISIVSTALPTIADDLGSAELFVWVANAYILATTVVQPIFGQMANIFGRRSLTIVAVLVFMLGSGLAGGANSTGMLIGARAVQGVGGGGIITLGEIIICDLVPLLERGQYSGLIAGTYAIGTIIGPVLGGLFTDHTSWRWVFYINLPICGAALLLIVPFLNLKYRREGTIWTVSSALTGLETQCSLPPLQLSSLLSPGLARSIRGDLGGRWCLLSWGFWVCLVSPLSSGPAMSMSRPRLRSFSQTERRSPFSSWHLYMAYSYSG